MLDVADVSRHVCCCRLYAATGCLNYPQGFKYIHLSIFLSVDSIRNVFSFFGSMAKPTKTRSGLLQKRMNFWSPIGK